MSELWPRKVSWIAQCGQGGANGLAAEIAPVVEDGGCFANNGCQSSGIVPSFSHCKTVHNPSLCPIPEKNRTKGFLRGDAEVGATAGDASAGRGIRSLSDDVIVSTPQS